ncbi:MAG: hypothetical protein JNM14_03990 [Ferruginibacter sp.]|nr:hypothetical protein [Ferruginibacter sp.]
MKRITTLLVFLLAANFCKGQSAPTTDTVYITDIKNEKSLLAQTQYCFESNSSLPITGVLQKSFQRFKSAFPKKRLSPETINSTLYLKVLLKNNSAKTVSAYLDPGMYFTGFRVYKIEEKNISIQDSSNASNYKLITLDAGEAAYFLMQVTPLKTDVGAISPVLINADYLPQYKLVLTRHKSDIQVFGLVMSGVLIMMILFMLTSFIINRKKEFLYNAAYSFCMLLLIFFNSLLSRSSTGFVNFYYAYFDFFLLVTGSVFYMSFTRWFLDTIDNYKLLDSILRWSERFVMLLLVVFTCFHFFTDSFLPQFYLELGMKILFLLLGLTFIYLALKRKDRLFNYIAAGNAMLVSFSIISFILLSFKVKPTELYSTALFYYYLGIAGELTFFLLGLTYKNKKELIQEIRKKEAHKQEERNRISADMHDDLGAGMTSIRLYSELAKNKLTNTPIPEIEKISSAANELLTKMNAIIWSMNNSNDSLSNMIAYIRSYALEYFEDTGVHCKIDIPENLPNIQVIGNIRRNIFLVVKEALNNILKHSKATEVSITLVRVDDSLTLYIHDNGPGIDMKKLRQFGNGLKNMKKRMADIGGDFNIENKNGTLITMHRKVQQF